ncbi:PAS domain S-box protein [Oceanisphaera psychrotolerans]|uniref:PAS domain S-box protein n=1 Tax=Oceanisphaera psychrotolerans TaxID=1414654 RepID=UPI001FE1EAB1|nr:LytS/YhcK type 5TM receptor domain-containing protein [Oceanisphaera psychrotolerans]
MLISIIEQAILILASGWLLTINVRRGQQHPRLLVLTSGILFGVIAIACMSLPLIIGPGVLLDVRDAVLFVAGLFSGPLSGGLALLMAGGFRLWLSGPGTMIGILCMVLALVLGLGVRYAWQRGWIRLNLWSLLPVTLFLHATKMGLVFLAVEPQQRQHILSLTWPFLLVVVPLTLMLVFILKDARQRLREQQALHDSQARLMAITRALPDLMCVIDEDGRYLEVMADDARLPHVAIDRLQGHTVRDIFPPEQADALLAFVRQTLRQKTVNTLTYELNTEHGCHVFECVAQRLESRHLDKPAVVTLSRDISARVKNETDLRIAAVAFESTQAMLVTDAHNRILRVNRAFSEITGYTEDEVKAIRQPYSALASTMPRFIGRCGTVLHRRGAGRGKSSTSASPVIAIRNGCRSAR